MVSDMKIKELNAVFLRSLNPSFNGIWSRTVLRFDYKTRASLVLILLLMEYGLGLEAVESWWRPCSGLNPSFNGIWSRTSSRK